jgi:hypothetical protein
MTPLALEMLVYFCTRAVPEADPFPNIHLNPQQEIVRWMEDAGVIRQSGHKDKPIATDKGRAWLDMILETPMPVQQWIDPRAGADFIPAATIERTSLAIFGGHTFVDRPNAASEPMPPKLPDGFTAWGGKLGTVYDPGLKTDVKVTVPNGIGVDTNVVVFQRNGQLRNVKGQQRFPAGTINWDWAKEPDPAMIPQGQEKKAAERFKRQQAEDVIGYAIIPGEDDHLRRDIK